MSWTKERVDILEKMWTDGKSAAEIAKSLGEGVTRNAVIGKAHRMGLSGRPSPIKKTKTALNKTTKKTAKPSAPKSKVAPKKKKSFEGEPLPKSIKPIPAAPLRKKKEMPTGDGLTILDLTDRICKWPFGDPQDADFHFCGEAVHPSKPYCLVHCAEAYQTLSRKKKSRKTKLKLTAGDVTKKDPETEDDDDEEDEDLEDIENLDVDALENADNDDDDDDDLTEVTK